jgi:hypothetical protein
LHGSVRLPEALKRKVRVSGMSKESSTPRMPASSTLTYVVGGRPIELSGSLMHQAPDDWQVTRVILSWKRVS